MDSVNEAHAQHGCGSQWYSINGIGVVSESGLTGVWPGAPGEGVMGAEQCGGCCGSRVRADKLLDLTETPSLAHDMGMKMPLKHRRGLRETISGTVCTGGSQAGKQRPGPQSQLGPHTAEHPQVSLLTSLGSGLPSVK